MKRDYTRSLFFLNRRVNMLQFDKLDEHIDKVKYTMDNKIAEMLKTVILKEDSKELDSVYDLIEYVKRNPKYEVNCILEPMPGLRHYYVKVDKVIRAEFKVTRYIDPFERDGYSFKMVSTVSEIKYYD